MCSSEDEADYNTHDLNVGLNEWMMGLMIPVCVCVCIVIMCSSSDEDEADYNTHDLYVGLNE